MPESHSPFEGIHVVATLYGCPPSPALTEQDHLLALCRGAVDDAGLTRIGEASRSFGPGQGVSLAVLLAESHVALHTWPELAAVTLDVYTCNHTQDNTAAARSVVTSLTAHFQPQRVVRQEIARDRQLVLEPIGEGYGVYIESRGARIDRRTAYQHLELHDTPRFGSLLRLDGRNQCTDAEAFIYHEALVHPAAVTHPGPRDVLIIGGGDGGSIVEVLRHPTVRNVTLVELDEQVIDVARSYLGEIHEQAFDDPRVTVLVEDGIRFLERDDTAWDLILLDLTDAAGPAEPLYGDDFLGTCRSRLRPGGFLVAHIDAPFSEPERTRKHHDTLSRVFGVVRVQLVNVPIYGELAIAVCSEHSDPVSLGADDVDRRLAERAISGLRTYDGDTHRARFALPPWARDVLGVGPLPR